MATFREFRNGNFPILSLILISRDLIGCRITNSQLAQYFHSATDFDFLSESLLLSSASNNESLIDS